MNGIVRRFDFRRGYGFIEGLTGHPGSNPEFFFHISSVRDQIPPPIGCEVTFTAVRGERGPQAAGVQMVRVRQGPRTSGQESAPWQRNLWRLVRSPAPGGSL